MVVPWGTGKKETWIPGWVGPTWRIHVLKCGFCFVLQTISENFLFWNSAVMDLLGRSRQVVPVHMRTQKVESPLPAQSICPVSVNGVRMDSASVYKVSMSPRVSVLAALDRYWVSCSHHKGEEPSPWDHMVGNCSKRYFPCKSLPNSFTPPPPDFSQYPYAKLPFPISETQITIIEIL